MSKLKCGVWLLQAEPWKLWDIWVDMSVGDRKEYRYYTHGLPASESYYEPLALRLGLPAVRGLGCCEELGLRQDGESLGTTDSKLYPLSRNSPQEDF